MEKIIKYKVKNWKEYNSNLIQRGNFLRYLVEVPEEFKEVLTKKWFNKKKRKGKGKNFVYSDYAIEVILILSRLYRLPLRQAQGFTETLFRNMGINLPVPSYTQICRRQKKLEIKIEKEVKKIRRQMEELEEMGEKLIIVIDASGLKVYGEGEWLKKTHPKNQSNRREWKKIHIVVEPQTGLIYNAILTDSHIHDSEVYPQCIKELGKEGYNIDKAIVDKAYDCNKLYNISDFYNIQFIVPPRKNSAYYKNKFKNNLIYFREPYYHKQKKKHLEFIAEFGEGLWKEMVEYGLRSRVESEFSRFKRYFTEKLSSKCIQNQITEIKTKIKLLNLMYQIAKCKVYKEITII